MMKVYLSTFVIFSIVSQSVVASDQTVARRLQKHALQKLQVQATFGAVPERKIALFGWGKKKDQVETIDPEEAQAGTPDTLAEGEVSPEIMEIIPQGPLTATQSWQKPNYALQTGALGYSENTFATPEGLKKRVAFWRDIYSKYTTNQGVMHDSLHIHVVFHPVDFNSIMRDTSTNSRQKHHARERLVNGYRRDIEDRLMKLSKLKSSDGLIGEDLQVWKMYEGVDDPDKFNAATKRGRIRFQLGQKDRFALGIYYSGRYIREMEKIFKSEGLPIELTRLPFVESSFNIYARSRVGASGIWQFMRRTARPYMMVNNSVDERNDPIKATRSSAKLLKSNYMMLKSWPLALTGYNHGPSGIARIVKKTGTNDLTEIINKYSSRRFGFASENFYACFLAALEVERNATKYFGGVKWSVPLDHAEIKLSKPVPFEAVKVWFRDDAELAQLFNPHFSPNVRKGRLDMPRGTNIRIPPAMREVAEEFLSGKTKLTEMRDQARKSYKKIPILPEGTPVATISAVPPAVPSAAPTVTPPPAVTKEDDEEVLEEMPADSGVNATPDSKAEQF